MNKYLKPTLFSILFILGAAPLLAQNPNYNDSLAKKLGADEYGMKKYTLVILKTGSNTTTDKRFIDSCFQGHMSNMEIMMKAGKLIVAGPIEKNEKKYRGIFILDVKNKEEAHNLLQNDPAIQSKLLEPELYNWYGSAALPVYLETSEKIWKKNP